MYDVCEWQLILFCWKNADYNSPRATKLERDQTPTSIYYQLAMHKNLFCEARLFVKGRQLRAMQMILDL